MTKRHTVTYDTICTYKDSPYHIPKLSDADIVKIIQTDDLLCRVNIYPRDVEYGIKETINPDKSKTVYYKYNKKTKTRTIIPETTYYSVVHWCINSLERKISRWEKSPNTENYLLQRYKQSLQSLRSEPENLMIVPPPGISYPNKNVEFSKVTFPEVKITYTITLTYYTS